MKIEDAIKADDDSKDRKKAIFILASGEVEPTMYRVASREPHVQVKSPDWESADRATVHLRIIEATLRKFKDKGFLYILDSFGFKEVDPIPKGEWYWDCVFSQFLYSPSQKELDVGEWTAPPKPANPLEAQ